MDMIMISELSKELLEFLDCRAVKLKPEEKVAALNAAAGTITAVISAESLQLFYVNLFTKGLNK